MLLSDIYISSSIEYLQLNHPLKVIKSNKINQYINHTNNNSPIDNADKVENENIPSLFCGDFLYINNETPIVINKTLIYL